MLAVHQVKVSQLATASWNTEQEKGLGADSGILKVEEQSLETVPSLSHIKVFGPRRPEQRTCINCKPTLETVHLLNIVDSTGWLANECSIHTLQLSLVHSTMPCGLDSSMAGSAEALQWDVWETLKGRSSDKVLYSDTVDN